MKKSLKAIAIAGALAGVLVVGGVGAVALANGNAYENYKAAAFKTMEVENMTTESSYTIRQDGQSIITGSTHSQSSGESHYSSSKIDVNGETMELETASDSSTMITRINDQYSSYNELLDEDYYEDREDRSPNKEKLANTVIDLLMGDTKSHFTGSGDQVSLNLEGAQIPELVNLAVSAMVEERMDEKVQIPEGEFDALHAAIKNMPITQDASISRIGLEGTMKDGYLGDNTMTIVLTGKDSSGATHELEIVITSSISEIGSTTPATIDTTGKTVVEQNWDSLDRFDH